MDNSFRGDSKQRTDRQPFDLYLGCFFPLLRRPVIVRWGVNYDNISRRNSIQESKNELFGKHSCHSIRVFTILFKSLPTLELWIGSKFSGSFLARDLFLNNPHVTSPNLSHLILGTPLDVLHLGILGPPRDPLISPGANKFWKEIHQDVEK